MDSTETSLEETHQLGPSKVIAVRASEEERRTWLADTPVCPLLQQMNIAHVGVLHAIAPFTVVRSFQSGTYMFACAAGRGEVLVDGRWTSVSAGEACLLPPFVANAIRAVEGDPAWEFCWVRYLESQDRLPIVSSKSPVKGPFDSQSLYHAVMGLHAETAQSAPSAAQSHLWIELIHSYVMAFAQPSHGDERLWRVWQKVESDLNHPWSVSNMASVAAVSEEHLRRLSLREIGRSPMKQVIFLRMQRACHLLATTDDKIETVAHEVGYHNPFTFSTTFKKWIGRRPSEYRNASFRAGADLSVI